MIIKPMLAVKTEIEDITNYPVMVSPKLDGIRALVVGGKLLTRKFKPIGNKYITEMFSRPEFEGLDGELIIGADNTPEAYNNTTGAVRRSEGEPDVTYHVFDKYDATLPFFTRHTILANIDHPRIKVVPHHMAFDAEQVADLEQMFLAQGYEGAMIRGHQSPYKFGRSTLKEGYLLKLKRFSDAEAEIIGFQQLMSNQNEAMKDAFGRTERSTHKENQVPVNKLGSLLVKTPEGLIFNIGSGFDDATRCHIWENQAEFLGKFAKYKYQEIGSKEAPRFPIYLGLRLEEDM